MFLTLVASRIRALHHAPCQEPTPTVNSTSILFTPLLPHIAPNAGSSQTPFTTVNLSNEGLNPTAKHADLENTFKGLSDFNGELLDHPEDQDMHNLDQELDLTTN
ncbi:hypothetical protein H2248_004286 [Termitomyces sp. 'cryptogamus']|nr:hypothetical protein H2248_004286 [Termitomyces sp. 'cryptogamus']